LEALARGFAGVDQPMLDLAGRELAFELGVESAPAAAGAVQRGPVKVVAVRRTEDRHADVARPWRLLVDIGGPGAARCKAVAIVVERVGALEGHRAEPVILAQPLHREAGCAKADFRPHGHAGAKPARQVAIAVAVAAGAAKAVDSVGAL